MLPTDPWPVLWTCSEVDTASPAATGLAVKAATQVLWALSGQQFGLSSITMRPCRRSCPGVVGWRPEWPVAYGWPYPTLVDGAWINLACGSCPGECGCNPLHEAVLPGPVRAVIEVKLDGVELAATAYRLDRHAAAAGDLLVRVDGDSWPRCQDLALADSQAGTWSVQAQYGMDVPEMGQLAVGEFACEWLKALRGEDCRSAAIARTVTSMTRAGVTLQLPDPTSLLDQGKLGLALCDWFIQAVNPAGLRSRARVLSPDSLPPRRTGV
jgi:hypothetical protein